MPSSNKPIITICGILLSLTACAKIPILLTPTQEPGIVLQHESVVTSVPTITPTYEFQVSSSTEPVTNDYSLCGNGQLINVPYFFKDDNGYLSPTQLIQTSKTSDDVRDYIAVITCLKYDDGWPSDPDEVENGYENEIVFFDSKGQEHTYRIIIGGHYVAPYDPTHKDITASLNGVEDHFLTIEEWMKASEDYFSNNGSRQIGVNIYIDDTQGNLSRVLTQAYQFRDTNWQIARALQTGEGYPEQVPEGFFLFATKAWLIYPD